MNYVIELLERKLAEETFYFENHIPKKHLEDEPNNALLKSRTLASQRMPQLSKALEILKNTSYLHS